MKWIIVSMLVLGASFGVGSFVGRHYQQSMFERCAKHYAELEFATPDDKQTMDEALHQLEACMSNSDLAAYKQKLGYK